MQQSSRKLSRFAALEREDTIGDEAKPAGAGYAIREQLNLSKGAGDKEIIGALLQMIAALNAKCASARPLCSAARFPVSFPIHRPPALNRAERQRRALRLRHLTARHREKREQGAGVPAAEGVCDGTRDARRQVISQ